MDGLDERARMVCITLGLRGELQRLPTFANAVYRIEDHILKVYSSVDECANTQRMYSLISQHGLPCPEIIAQGTSPVPYLLMSFLDGMPIAEQATPEAYRSFGAWVGRLHSITFDAFGGIQDGGIGEFHEIGAGPFQDWKSMHCALAEKRMRGFDATILAPLLPFIKAHFRDAEYGDISPSLVHEDLNATNVFVKEGKVVGVIDPDGGYAGCAEEELMRIEIGHFKKREDLREAFFEGYTKHKRLLDGYERRKPTFRLSRTLVEAQCLINLETYKAGRKEEAMREAYDIIAGICHAPG